MIQFRWIGKSWYQVPRSVYSPASDRCPVSETPDTPAKSEAPAKPQKAAGAKGSSEKDVPIKTDKSKTPPAPELSSTPADVAKPSEKATDAKAGQADKAVSAPKQAATEKAAQPSKTVEPDKAAKAAKTDTSDKPAKPAKPAAKPKPEDKPFAAFIQDDLLPSLTKALTERQHPPISLELVEGERPVVGGNCWMVQGELSAGRRFWLCFESDAITSGKTIALAESGSDPSLLESFLIDEKRINQALLESRLLQRLNGQKWFGGN